MAKKTQAKINSMGTCVFCEGEFEKSRMAQHLKTCKQRAAANAANLENAQEGQIAKLYHIVVEGEYRPQYWMHLELPGWIKLRQLDNLLRMTWLECCGHLSEFKIGKTRYVSHVEDEEDDEGDAEVPAEEMPDNNIEAQIADMLAKNEISPEMVPLLRSYASQSQAVHREQGEKGMGVQLDKVFTPGEKISYTYDFGSSTELLIKVVAEREGVIANDDTILLARNIPPAIVCDKCGQPAEHVVTFTEEWGNYDFLCTACVKQIASSGGTEDMAELLEAGEEGEDYYYEGLLPVVNSPRMGVCGYTGEAEFMGDDEWEDEEAEETQEI